MFKNIDLRSKRRTKSRTKAQVRHSDHETSIVEHVTRHLAAPSFVIHEIESTLVHLDVHVVAPRPAHDFWFLFTTGMSARPMKKPHDAPGSALAEVSLLLPRDWRLDRESWHDTRWSWPIRELKEAALVPHRFQTWLGYGHTIIPNDIDASFQVRQSLDRSTRLSSLLVTTSELLPEAIHTIESGTQQIDLLMLLPMYPEELELRISHGAHALLDAFTTAGVSDVIDPARPSAIAGAANC